MTKVYKSPFSFAIPMGCVSLGVMKKYLITPLIAILAMSLSSCNDESPSKDSTSELEQAATEKNQRGLLKVQPPVQLDWSLERDQINRRTNLWNDENKVSYIYCMSFGKVLMFSPVKGKVSSVNSQVTNPEQAKYWQADDGTGITNTAISLPSPAEDGSYGENGDAVFWFTPRGTYYEWNGEYMLADEPFKLTTPPVIVIEE